MSLPSFETLIEALEFRTSTLAALANYPGRQQSIRDPRGRTHQIVAPTCAINGV
ncbi:hypothetical protein [Laspinema palackyanum]|uniref:hypothetical protein n=1 Tax=Laspinema palackyanum TaxID=3231601 RepID=UPI00349F6757